MLLPEPEAEETVLTNIPKGHVNARTKYKTPYVFEIIERNGNIHTFCSAESKRRRMWLRFIDAKARPLDLMDLKLAYLDSGDGGVEEEMGVETELSTNGEEDGGENGEVREGETKETKVATSTVVCQTVTAWEDYLLDDEEEGKYFKIERERASRIIFFTTHSILLFL